MMDNRILCPMTGQECTSKCPWRVEEQCAVRMLALESSAMVESYMVVNRIKTEHKEEIEQ